MRQAKAEIHKFAKKTEGDYKALASQAPDDNAADRQNVDECVGQLINRTFHLLRESIDALNASDFLDADGLAKSVKTLEAFRKSILKRVQAMPPLCDGEDMDAPEVSQATVDEWKKAVAQIELEVRVDATTKSGDELPVGAEATESRSLRRTAARLASSAAATVKNIASPARASKSKPSTPVTKGPVMMSTPNDETAKLPAPPTKPPGVDDRVGQWVQEAQPSADGGAVPPLPVSADLRKKLDDEAEKVKKAEEEGKKQEEALKEDEGRLEAAREKKEREQKEKEEKEREKKEEAAKKAARKEEANRKKKEEAKKE